jgi:hypothetical protein
VAQESPQISSHGAIEPIKYSLKRSKQRVSTCEVVRFLVETLVEGEIDRSAIIGSSAGRGFRRIRDELTYVRVSRIQSF